MTYVERYLNGEYEQVWEELIQLGDAVRQELLYSDALAVARNMMRRVRKNIELLIARLPLCGFVFGYDHRLLFRKDPEETFAHLQSRYLEQWVIARAQFPLFVSEKLFEDEMNQFEKETSPDSGDFQVQLPDIPLYDKQQFEQNPVYRREVLQRLEQILGPWPPDMVHYIDEIERVIGPVPLEIRAWYEEVGGVNLYRYHPGWDALSRASHPWQQGQVQSFLMRDCNPLQVIPLHEAFIEQLRRTHVSGQPYLFVFGDDRVEQEYFLDPSPYGFLLPDRGADASLDGLRWMGPFMTFVKYLRFCLKWAGFPGIAI
jgi:hypothetical protein